VGLPYLRARSQDYFERLGGGQDPDAVSEYPPEMAVTKVNHQTYSGECRSTAHVPLPPQSQRAFKLIYPYANLAMDLTFLGYDLAYLFERSDAYRPWHSWLGLRIERRGPDDETVSEDRARSLHQCLSR